MLAFLVILVRRPVRGGQSFSHEEQEEQLNEFLLAERLKRIDLTELRRADLGDVDRIFIRANQDRSEVLFLPLPGS